MEKLEIDERLGIAKVYAPYDRALKGLESQGFRELFLAEYAKLRIQEGKDSDLEYANLVREDVVYVPGKGTFLTRVPLISDSPKKATQAHKDGDEYYPTRTQIRVALEDSIQIPSDLKSIPTNRFNENEIAVYAFGITHGVDIKQDEKDAQRYGDFLRDIGIQKMLVSSMPVCFPTRDYVNRRNKPFVRKLKFNSLDKGSCLAGYNWGLHFYDILRGISKDAVEQKMKPKYTNPFEIEIPKIDGEK